MQRLFLVPLLSLGLLCASCHEKTPKVSSRRLADESAGRAALARARQQLATQHYDSARATIRTMRRAHPHALTAREDGILLMDSIDLTATRTAIDQLERFPHSPDVPNAHSRRQGSAALPELYRRLRFYERKLQHDHRQRKSHD